MNKSIFREYDIRGLVEDDLTDDVVYDLGRAFGTLMAQKNFHTVACGYDLRLSSPRLHELFTSGVLSTGRDVVTIGQVPTPVLYFAVLFLETDAGVMITGSHNPIEFNGFKMNDRDGSIYGTQIQKLRQIIENQS